MPSPPPHDPPTDHPQGLPVRDHAKGADTDLSRRDFLRGAARALALLGLGSVAGFSASRPARGDVLWQIDPNACIQCGNCATECVLEESAVKCVHSYSICGYCSLCTGFFEPRPSALDTGAENQLCPTGAVQRTYVEEPYYEYTIDEDLCVGCGKCVKGCTMFGNGSLYLQIRHDRCVHCNECAIARTCPTDAFRQVSAESPYLLKNRGPA